MPRESFVWVSAFPLPRGGRGRPLSLGWTLCPVGADHQSSVPPPCPPDRDECSEGPTPCSHSCHNAPGRFSCSCPLGFALARDDRNCRGEWAPGQKLSLKSAWACAGLSILEPRTPARGMRLRTWPVPDSTGCEPGDGNTLFPSGISCCAGCRWEELGCWGDREPRGHTRGHPGFMARAPAEPGHSLAAFPTTPWSLPTDWVRKWVNSHLPHLLCLPPSQGFWTANPTLGC